MTDSLHTTSVQTQTWSNYQSPFTNGDAADFVGILDAGASVCEQGRFQLMTLGTEACGDL